MAWYRKWLCILIKKKGLGIKKGLALALVELGQGAKMDWYRKLLGMLGIENGKETCLYMLIQYS